MGCKGSRHYASSSAGSKYSGSAGVGAAPLLEAPSDDVVPWICSLGNSSFAAAGVDGWIHVYNVDKVELVAKFQAHRKAVNRVLPLGDGQLLSASADATVRLWPREAALGRGGEPQLTLSGHQMEVSAIDVLDGEEGSVLFTGSRDCSVGLWDLQTGRLLQSQKILRNVVTAVRRLPGRPHEVVQSSEDLQLRLWDIRSGPRPAHAVPAGPNQLICLDVSDDGFFVACGSKGFSRENCEVKVFDLRKGLGAFSAAPCADQTIEALRIASPDRCAIASKDGFVRSVAIPEVRVVAECGPGRAGYTALGLQRRPSGGPLALVAAAGPEGASIEALAWQTAELSDVPTVLAAT